MINWLASYPKSGNTWVRIFLSAYGSDSEPDINALVGSHTDQNVIAYRVGFQIDYDTLPKHLKMLMQGAALLRLSESYKKQVYIGKGDIEYPFICKTHNSNANVGTVRLIMPEITKKVLLIVRDPRDVAISYAKHFGLDVDGAIDSMLDVRTGLYDETSRDKNCHFTSSWAEHTKSYAEAKGIDVTIVKYEQLKENPVKYFTWILNWYGIPVDNDRVVRAVENCELSKLRKQEKEAGFKEKSHKSDKFFGKGQVNGWVDILTDKQIQRIEEYSGNVMNAFGYPLLMDTKKTA